jgi:ATP-dependent protease ClpP protease subunit
MARTTSGTLELEERTGSDPGGWHDGWLNPKRGDVNDLVIAIEDGNVPQMSFAFMIPEGGGRWSDDFSEFEISEYDIDGGDVSAVNYGANPYTDITARTSEILSDMERLPQGALTEAYERLTARSRTLVPREHVNLRRAPRATDATSPVIRRLQGRIVRTHARFVDLANQADLTVADLATVRLPWYEIRNAAGGGGPAGEGEPDTADIYVFDEIGGSFGVDAKTFAEDLNAITAPKIKLHINSPGGSVTEGMAIRSALMQHSSWITAYVDGIAASAASIIALGADEIETMEGAQWMLHDASATIEGNEAELTKSATWIGRQSNNLADIYAKRMNITTEDARQMMLDETWAFADESVSLGLADRVGGRNPAKVPPQDMAERMSRKHDLTRFGYRFLSRENAPAPRQTRGTGFAKGGMIERQATPEQPRGRSIALIEAQLGLDEHR